MLKKAGIGEKGGKPKGKITVENQTTKANQQAKGIRKSWKERLIGKQRKVDKHC